MPRLEFELVYNDIAVQHVRELPIDVFKLRKFIERDVFQTHEQNQDKRGK